MMLYAAMAQAATQANPFDTWLHAAKSLNEATAKSDRMAPVECLVPQAAAIYERFPLTSPLGTVLNYKQPELKATSDQFCGGSVPSFLLRGLRVVDRAFLKYTLDRTGASVADLSALMDIVDKVQAIQDPQVDEATLLMMNAVAVLGRMRKEDYERVSELVENPAWYEEDHSKNLFNAFDDQYSLLMGSKGEKNIKRWSFMAHRLMERRAVALESLHSVLSIVREANAYQRTLYGQRISNFTLNRIGLKEMELHFDAGISFDLSDMLDALKKNAAMFDTMWHDFFKSTEDKLPWNEEPDWLPSAWYGYSYFANVDMQTLDAETGNPLSTTDFAMLLNDLTDHSLLDLKLFKRTLAGVPFSAPDETDAWRKGQQEFAARIVPTIEDLMANLRKAQRPRTGLKINGSTTIMQPLPEEELVLLDRFDEPYYVDMSWPWIGAEVATTMKPATTTSATTSWAYREVVG